MCEEEFQKYSEYERIEKFSHPKVLRLLDILRIYRPPIPSMPTCAESVELTDSLVSSEESTVQTPKVATEKAQSSELLETGPAILRQPGHTSRRRRPDFSNRHHRNREDAYQLCGMIFTERRTTAKLLYHLLKVPKRQSFALCSAMLHSYKPFQFFRMQVDVIHS